MAITTTGLTKRFGDRTAVRDLDLSVPGGVVSGFIGPNGAGKTTTMRMLLGLLRPSAGEGHVLGAPLTAPDAYLDRVGAMIEEPAFYPALSGSSNLLVLTRLAGITRVRVPAALERVGLANRGDDPVRHYSHGMKQRLGIAAALLPTPRLLVLDEPTSGLDPAGIAEIRRLVRSLADEGITVFTSSHLLSEVEQICEHLVVIRDGRLIFQGPAGDLLAAQHPELLARPEHGADAERLVALVNQAGRHARMSGDDDTVHVSADGTWAAALNRIAASAGITLVHLSEQRAGLEEAFFALTGAAHRSSTASPTIKEPR